jgi:hypothetical protein
LARAPVHAKVPRVEEGRDNIKGSVIKPGQPPAVKPKFV